MKSRTVGVNRTKPQLLMTYPHMFGRMEVRTINGHPIWKLFRTYFNKLDINAEFNRSDILHSVYVPDVAKEIKRYETTVDQYRRYVELAFCLEKIGWGVYKKIRNIPENLSSISHLKKRVYDKTWRSWFIPIEEW